MTIISQELEAALGPDIRVERALLGGGMSRVYLARDLSLGRDIVVKVLPHDLVTDVSTARFRREIALMVRLQHPHILPILRAGTADDSLFYLSPYISGETLKDWLTREQALPLEDTVRVLGQLASALVFAHAHGVVHRDVKPANIFLSEGHAILADFGIARALAPDEEQLTLTDTSPGTPAYLAPERPRDASADLYALAVVGHEMLTGTRPEGVVTVQGILGARSALTGGGTDNRTRAVATAIARALSPHPKDRFRTAAAFKHAVEHPQRHLAGRVIRHIAPIAGAALILIASGSIVYTTRASTRVVLVEDRYLVLPFATSGTSGGAQGERLASELAASLAAWRGVQVARLDSLDADLRQRDRDIPISRALHAARGQGASRLVTGRIMESGNAASVLATLWDVRTSKPLRTISSGPITTNDGRGKMRWLANAILRETDDSPPTLADPVVAALRAFDRARSYEKAWKLDSAATTFQEAIRLDGRLAVAHLGLARVLTWKDDRADRQQRDAAAEKAVMLTEQLEPSDSALATALASQANSDWEAACKGFDWLLARDPHGFPALIGSGDCRARDRGVIRDRASSSGWRFRGSYADAASYYERALTVAGGRPDFVYRRLRGVLPLEANRVRQGQEAGGVRRFQALAEVQGGTVVYVPHDVSRQLAPIPATLDAALRLNRRRLRPALVAWVRAHDASPEPHRHLSELLELEGAITEGGADDLVALNEIRTARRLTTGRWEQPRLAQIQIRQLIKNGDYHEARRLADSVLGDASYMTHPDSAVQVAGTLAALAALTGRTELVVRLTRIASMTPKQQVLAPGRDMETGPAVIAREAAELQALAALGVCNDDLRARAEGLIRLARANFGEGREADHEVEPLIAPALDASVPCLGVGIVEGIRTFRTPLLAAHQALGRGDRAQVHAYLSAAQRRLRENPHHVTMDQVMDEASLLMRIGKSDAAREHAERALMGLSSGPLSTLERVAQCGALLRAMVLVARSAHEAGDRHTASRWASAVVTLWANADSSLQPVVGQMRAIAPE